MKSRRRRRRYGLPLWLIIESILVTVTSVTAFALLQLDRFHLSDDSFYLVLGAAVTVGAIVATTSALFSRAFNRLISKLIRGLRAVADGDFSCRLDPEEGGPLAATYADFNKMGEELQSIQTLRDDFINHFSHEFKTPITAVKGFAELLREPNITPEEREQYLQIILDESSRLADLANSALLLTRLESQQLIIEKKRYSLDEEIKRCAILLSHSWEEKHISFTANLEPVEYNGNEELMRHVWLNLFNNAIKYTPDGGEVTVTLRASPEELTVSVADTGIGMAPEIQAHIFDPYYQGNSGGSSRGLGLGLSIVRRIVDLCGGTIQVSSIPNQGSTFTVRLPRC